MRLYAEFCASKNYLKKTLVTYSIWSFFYYLIDFLSWGHSDIKGFLATSIKNFVISGSHYHFWFFPALIFSVCLTTLLFKIKCRKIIIPLSIILYIIGCMGCSYYYLGIQIPILKNLFLSSHFNLIRRVLLMGFPFFSLGYLSYKIVNHISKRSLLFLLFPAIAVWLAEIGIVIKADWQINIIITLGLYLMLLVVLLILLKIPMEKYSRIGNMSKVAANFVYYAHPLFRIVLTYLDNYVLHMTFTQTPIFILSVCMCTTVSLIIYKINNRYMNMLVI